MRNLKTLGLALVAVFAMSAVVASAASAHVFTFEASPTTLTASQEGTNNNKFKVLGQTVECHVATFEATATGATLGEITGVVPTYHECSIGGVPATIDVGTCTYTLTGTTHTANHATVKVANCGATPLRITIPALNCLITIGNQTAEEGVKYTNVAGNPSATTNSVTIDLTAKATITVEHTGAATPICNEITAVTKGRLTGQIEITGENPTTGAHQGGTFS